MYAMDVNLIIFVFADLNEERKVLPAYISTWAQKFLIKKKIYIYTTWFCLKLALYSVV